MASLFGRIKCFLSTFLLLYVVYLLSYKCVQLRETPLEHVTENVLHPLTHTHNQLCDTLSRGEQFVAPYVDHAKSFLEKNVYSNEKYVEYKISDKVGLVQAKYYEFVHPLVIKLFQIIEVIEYHVTEHLIEVYAKLQGLYHSKVAPKLT